MLIYSMWYLHQRNDILYNWFRFIIVAGIRSVRVVGYYHSIPTTFSVDYDSVLFDSSFSMSLLYDMIFGCNVAMEQRTTFILHILHVFHSLFYLYRSF